MDSNTASSYSTKIFTIFLVTKLVLLSFSKSLHILFVSSKTDVATFLRLRNFIVLITKSLETIKFKRLEEKSLIPLLHTCAIKKANNIIEIISYFTFKSDIPEYITKAYTTLKERIKDDDVLRSKLFEFLENTPISKSLYQNIEYKDQSKNNTASEFIEVSIVHFIEEIKKGLHI